LQRVFSAVEGVEYAGETGHLEQSPHARIRLQEHRFSPDLLGPVQQPQQSAKTRAVEVAQAGHVHQHPAAAGGEQLLQASLEMVTGPDVDLALEDYGGEVFFVVSDPDLQHGQHPFRLTI
jgi:hypothetical protein